MSNTLGYYVPEFYAQEALIQLEKALGMAGRVHRGYDAERRAFNKGEYINISKPSTFTAQNAPSSAQDLDTDSVQIQLSNWKEVKFALTDKELTLAKETLIADHIRPAAYALADNIDQALAAQYSNIPWYYDLAGTTDVKDVIGPRTVMFNNGVPVEDPGRMHYMIDGTLQQELLALSAFSQYQGGGDAGVNTQMRGSLGTKYGVEIFANQNTPSHTKGTLADSSPDANLTGAHSKGATSVDIDATGLTGTFLAGDVFTIAGNTQKYAATADATAAANAISINITPALVQDYPANAAITWRLDSHTSNLMFHRNAFALATAPLSEMGNELGAKIATITDPITGLSIRSRVYYVGNSSAVHVALDILYGLKTLDPNLACRGCG